MRVGAAILLVLLGASAASAQSVEHHGVTAEVGIGANVTFFVPAAPVVSAGVGGWLSRRTALTGRAFGMTSETEVYRRYLLFVGPAVQYWVNRWLWLGYGAGYCQFNEEVQSLPPDSTTDRGFELDLRIGAALTVAPHHTVNLSAEVG